MTEQRHHSLRDSHRTNGTLDRPRNLNPSEVGELKSAVNELRNYFVLHFRYHYLLLFLFGVFASYFYYHFPWTPISHRQLHFPAEHFLKIRDDFAIYFKAAEEKQRQADTNLKEALASLKLALGMHIAGKDEKAQKLLEHAYALAPKHPEVLIKFGEYLEQKDAVLADQYYFQIKFECLNKSEKKEKIDKSEEMVTKAYELLTKVEDELDCAAKVWTKKLRQLEENQRQLAEKLINDAIFLGQRKRLTDFFEISSGSSSVHS